MATLKIHNADSTVKYLNVIGAGTETIPYESVVPDYRIPYAVNQILVEDSETVSVHDKAKGLIKFGVNKDIDNNDTETVWQVGGDETYQTGNTINRIVSTNAGDSQDVIIEGHTLSGSDFTFVSQSATLNGTTAVTLTTPLARANRMYNDDSTDFAGVVTIKVNGGTTHLSNGEAGRNQSLKCATTLSSVDYWIITGMDINVERKSTAGVDFELQVREYGKTFRTKYFATANTGGRFINFNIPMIIKPNSDIRMVATAGADNTEVSAAIQGYLAEVQ